MDANEKRYLELLAKSFPTAAKASTEIVNLTAILNLPKGTEVFASDVHGEYEAFTHILRNGSGAVKLKLEDAFGDSLAQTDKRSLATLIFYPREKMAIELAAASDENAWYAQTLLRLVAVAKQAAGKYTRSKVRKTMPGEYAYIIEELMTESNLAVDKKAYYAAIIEAVIQCGQAPDLI